MQKMLIALLFALSLSSPAYADATTICGHIEVQKQCKDGSACVPHFELKTDGVSRLSLMAERNSSQEKQLLKAKPSQRVCVTGEEPSFEADIVTFR
jgi:hypothetical protein